MNENVEMLKKARLALVIDRRDTAGRMVNSQSAAASTQAAYFSAIQGAIESIDRAIEDEIKSAPQKPRVASPEDPYGELNQ
jgi:hypothetical protein